MADQVVAGGIVVFPEWGPLRVDLRASGGRIVEVGERLPARDGEAVLDATGRHVFAGFIDPHVHLGNANRFADDVATETLAAAAGGVTTLLTYVKVLRHRDSQVSYHEVLPEVLRAIDERASVDVGWHLAISTAQHVAEIPDYRRLGCHSFKFYMGYRDDPRALRRGSVGVDDGFILEAMRAIAAAGDGATALVHCENEDIARSLAARIPDPGRATWADWARTRPSLIEVEAIQRASLLAREAGAPLYIVHLSSREGLAAAREARARARAPVHVEVSTHHLLLTAEQAAALQPPGLAKVSPPIRERASVEALWQAVADGTVDTVGSDHVAMAWERKQGSALEADPGFAALDAFAPLVLTEACRRRVPLERVAQVCGGNSARIFGLRGKGTLVPGSDADLIVVNLDAPGRLEAARNRSASRFSPYDGAPVTARVEATVLRGETIVRDGRVVAERRGRALGGASAPA
jgi:dihydroorotase (multifunctional complex type)